ncbi:PREDICTED: uncharacterized protein LOC105970834 [Erythranthe guttata]|uniref:uncharacterized protein LOC105970834 n=1 Tax=Erythranthe guttata TaxID=4155 RepID=UPI00064D9772|nr:PREDICTED: uncharacterized protein LOC105970834 [Erythranthe guttata]|eukprot:XP_012851111.1 PREDICTED: uncharacterized protein LOC105970834 [Erythranthe guttata]
MDPTSAEAKAAVLAVHLARERNWTKVIIEGVSSVVISAIKGTSDSRAGYGNIIMDIKRISEDFEEFRVQHILREGNRVAHEVASLSKQGDYHLFDLPPLIHSALPQNSQILQNPDFEIPPYNITTNSSTTHLTKENPIPGWSFKGTVSYVTSGANLSFPGSGGAHAVQLGENGTISQTIRARGLMEYVLSFNLIPQSEDCANNRTAVNVSVHGKYDYSHRSKVFSLGRNLSMNLWGSYAFFLGRLAAESLNLHITSVSTTKAKDANNNVTCWPIVDAFTVRKNRLPMWEYENRLANGDFEIGPAFLKNSSDGILLDEE